MTKTSAMSAVMGGVRQPTTILGLGMITGTFAALQVYDPGSPMPVNVKQCAVLAKQQAVVP